MWWHFILSCSELKVYGNPDIVHLSEQTFLQIINYMYTGKNMRIFHECKVRTDKFVPRVIVLASRGSASYAKQ